MEIQLSRQQYLEQCQEAAFYLQTFIRANGDDFRESAIGTNPNEGWGRTEEAANAHSIATTLWHFTDENFRNCRFPENYGSPEAFKNRLLSFVNMLERDMSQLEEAIDRLLENAPMTLSMVHENLTSCHHAARETLAQLEAAYRAQHPELDLLMAIAPVRPIDRIQEIANRFPDVVRVMSKRRAQKPPLAIEDEYDVQYLFEGLLSASFSDVRPEKPTTVVAGGSGRADTWLKDERIVVEYKCTRGNLGAVDLRKQIADDFLLYGEDRDCDELFVFIYDKARTIINRQGFEKDLTRSVQGLSQVRIVVRD